MSPREARQVLFGLQSSVQLELPPPTVSSVSISHDDKQLDLTVVRPASPDKTVPVFMFFHGGGWVLGDFPTHERCDCKCIFDRSAAASTRNQK